MNGRWEIEVGSWGRAREILHFVQNIGGESSIEFEWKIPRFAPMLISQHTD